MFSERKRTAEGTTSTGIPRDCSVSRYDNRHGLTCGDKTVIRSRNGIHIWRHVIITVVCHGKCTLPASLIGNRAIQALLHCITAIDCGFEYSGLQIEVSCVRGGESPIL